MGFWQWLTGFSMFAMLVVCAGCEKTTAEPAAAATPNAVVASPTSTGAKTAGDDGAYLTSGPIIVENQLDVTAQREGMVIEILADTGARVTKGRVLARLDNRQLVADRSAAEANLHAAEANTKNWEAELKMAQADEARAEKMSKAELITKEQFEHVHFSQVAAGYQLDRERENQNHFRATIHSIELELDKTRIVAPFSGVVARRYIRMGQKVATNDRLFWITSTGPLKVTFTLPEEFLKSVRLGDKVQVSPIFDQDARYTATITSISPVVDPASETIEVKAQIQGETGELRPGMATNIRLRKR